MTIFLLVVRGSASFRTMVRLLEASASGETADIHTLDLDTLEGILPPPSPPPFSLVPAVLMFPNQSLTLNPPNSTVFGQRPADLQFIFRHLQKAPHWVYSVHFAQQVSQGCRHLHSALFQTTWHPQFRRCSLAQRVIRTVVLLVAWFTFSLQRSDGQSRSGPVRLQAGHTTGFFSFAKRLVRFRTLPWSTGKSCTTS